jgi:hypothetical protein
MAISPRYVRVRAQSTSRSPAVTTTATRTTASMDPAAPGDDERRAEQRGRQRSHERARHHEYPEAGRASSGWSRTESSTGGATQVLLVSAAARDRGTVSP